MDVQATFDAWRCKYQEQWSNLNGDPCIAAKLASGVLFYNGINITEQVLSPCDKRHQFICVGEFQPAKIFKLSPSEY